jgi:hypothetical protein
MTNQDALGYCEALDVSNPFSLAWRSHVTTPLRYLKYIVLRISRPNFKQQQPFPSIFTFYNLGECNCCLHSIGVLVVARYG